MVADATSSDNRVVVDILRVCGVGELYVYVSVAHE